MKAKLFFLTMLVSASANFSMAQVGIGTLAPNAALDVTSTNDGLLIPRVALVNTTTATVITPTKSELVYNTATVADVTPGFYYWETTPTVASDRWVRLTTSLNTNNWSVTGNTGTIPGTNFIGTTDANGLRIKTNNIDRWQISNANNGQLQSYALGTAALPVYSFQGDQDTGLFSSGADVLNLSTNGLERVRILSGGTIGINDAGSTATQVRIFSRLDAKRGLLVDTDTGTTANGADDAIVGFGDNSAGYGAGWFVNAATANGTGYGTAQMGYGILAMTADGGTYKTGVLGQCGGSARSSSGVFGGNYSGTAYNSWGALGYRLSTGATYYGGYFNSTTALGTGRTSSRDTQNIGFGAIGDYMGGWIKGGKYGLAVSGNEFGLFVEGKTYITDELIKREKGNDNQVSNTYAVFSVNKEINIKGKAILNNGTCTVDFDANFSKLIKNSENLVINITPMGKTEGVYIDSYNSKGFIVKENGDKVKSNNIKISWSVSIISDPNESKENNESIDKFERSLNNLLIDENTTAPSTVAKTLEKK